MGAFKKIVAFFVALGLAFPLSFLDPQIAHAASKKIRQEINIIDAYVGSGSGSYATSSAKIYIDTSKYTDATYYLEVVASTTSAVSSNVYLRNASTGATATTITFSNSNSYTRYRSNSFSPSTGEYVVVTGNEAVQKGVLAARVVILQDTDTLTSTQTQIEIGNEETYTSTATTTFSAPKYWYYDSTKWDGSPTFYAEVTYANIIEGSFASSTTYASAGTFTVATPVGTTQTVVELWGGGGAGGGSSANPGAGSGGAGGQYARSTLVGISGNKTLVVGAGGTGSAGAVGGRGASSTWDGTVVLAAGGAGGLVDSTAAVNGNTNACVGDTCFAGGNGAGAVLAGSAGGGGEGARSNGTGGSASGGTGGTGGDGGDGANGSSTDGAGATGSDPGGGGAGGKSTGNPNRAGGSGGAGEAIITNTITTIATTTIALQEDDGSFGSWTDKAYIVTNGVETSATRARSSSFTPTTGRNYRIVFRNGYTGATFAIYNAKIIVDQGSSPTKLEPQYLLANTSFNGSTGLKNFDILFDPAEWSGVTNTYYHEANGAAAGTGDVKLQSDPNGTPSDITGSTITNVIERERSTALTMPGASATIDVNVTGTGSLYGSRIIVETALNAATVPDAPTSLSASDGTNKVNLSWTAPASNGGSAITNYKIYRDTTSNPTTLIDTIGDVTTYQDTGTTNGILYYYRVKATNAIGDSAYSNESSATPTIGTAFGRIKLLGNRLKVFGGRIWFR